MWHKEYCNDNSIPLYSEDMSYTDDHGIKWYMFGYSYILDGKKFGVTLWARSYEDAKTKVLNALRNAQLDC